MSGGQSLSIIIDADRGGDSHVAGPLASNDLTVDVRVSKSKEQY